MAQMENYSPTKHFMFASTYTHTHTHTQPHADRRTFTIRQHWAIGPFSSTSSSAKSHTPGHRAWNARRETKMQVWFSCFGSYHSFTPRWFSILRESEPTDEPNRINERTQSIQQTMGDVTMLNARFWWWQWQACSDKSQKYTLIKIATANTRLSKVDKFCCRLSEVALCVALLSSSANEWAKWLWVSTEVHLSLVPASASAVEIDSVVSVDAIRPFWRW